MPPGISSTAGGVVRRIRWRPDEDARLRLLAPTSYAREIARAVGRSAWAVHSRARYLGVKIKRVPKVERAVNSTYHDRADRTWSEVTWEHLAWQYGPDRADAIFAGKDARTQSDLKAWRELGQRSAA